MNKEKMSFSTSAASKFITAFEKAFFISSIVVALTLPLQSLAFNYTHFKIQGFKSSTASPDSKVLAEADEARSFGEIGFKELVKARITVDQPNYKIELTGPHALFKSDEIVLSGSGCKIEYYSNSGAPGPKRNLKLAWTLWGMPPEERLYFSADDAVIKSSAYKFKLGKHMYTEGSIDIDLQKRTATMIGSGMKNNIVEKF